MQAFAPQLIVTLLLSTTAGSDALTTGGGPQQPVFRSGVDLVQVRAVVRDRRGRFVTGLSKEDFEVFDGAHFRPLVDLQFDAQSPIRVALLFDVSGSMRVSAKLDRAAVAARHFIAGLAPGDEAAVFTFDQSLRELQAFTSDHSAIASALADLQAFGLTSILDAAAETASRISAQSSARQAIVIVTDGVDTSSRMTAEEVSTMASAIDVPVYVFAVVAPIDHAGTDDAVRDAAAADADTALGRLALWTGGSIRTASTPAHAHTAALEILGELRHQYLLAFEPGPPGWRPLTVRATERGYAVRARAGYRSGSKSL